MDASIVKVSIDVLKVHPRNTEFFDDISGEAYETFKASIAEEGIISEIIVAPDMTIISGHQRYKAAKELGLTMVPIRVRDDLRDEDKKLKVLLAANFGREKNDESKQRKIATEYVRLCGYKNGEMGNGRKKECQVGTPTQMTLDEIAAQLGTSKRDLQRALSIERNLTESMKQLLDDGVISKTVAADLIASLSPEEQEELITSMDTTKKLTQKEVQKYVDEIKYLKEHPATQVPDDYADTKRQLAGYKNECALLQKDLENKVKEVQHLRKEIEIMENAPETEEYNQKLKNSTIFFCSRVADFLEKTGGYVWLTDHIKELPDYERKSYVSAAEAVHSWSYNLLNNIKEKMKEN